MSKKRLLLLSFIAVPLLVVVGLMGCYIYINRVIPPPLYAFASDRTGNGEIFVMAADEQLYNLTQSPTSDWDPVWSADGKQLAFTSLRSGDSDIWLAQPSENPADQPAFINITRHPAWDYSPTWSPSSQSVAFVSERDGDPEIFIQHLTSPKAIQLTFNDEFDHRPVWSPDGKYIAFAAVRDGVEQIHRIRPDGTDEQIITPSPLRGTAPAWSPDSQRIAFIGWSDDGAPGIYLIGPQQYDIEQLYQGDSWLGSLAWSADGTWLTYTAWDNGNHDVMALPVDGSEPPIYLTRHPAWDDFMSINPQAYFTPPQMAPNLVQAAPAHRPPPFEEVALGMNIADLSKAYLINDMGFDWAKSYVNWATVEPLKGEYIWTDPDNIVQAFGDQQLKILMRLNGTPTWNRPENTHLTHPPLDLTAYARFVTEVATRYKGQVHAYEIWNEPNLHYEWGYQTPDPVAYTALLKTAYTAIKAVDPSALVISGGLSTTGNGSEMAYGDIAFLEEMYRAGAKGYFDALGSHPYSFGLAPDVEDPDGLSLSRVAEQHAIMTQFDDGDTPIWITEVGWVLESSWDLDEHEKIGVTELDQAQYLARTYQKIEQDWPFVQGFFPFNLDFSTVTWYPAAEPMRWYAIMNPDRSPRPAYTALRQLRDMEDDD